MIKCEYSTFVAFVSLYLVHGPCDVCVLLKNILECGNKSCICFCGFSGGEFCFLYDDNCI